MKNSLLVRLFVLATLVVGMQSEIFPENSSASKKLTTTEVAKKYLSNLFFRKSSQSNKSGETVASGEEKRVNPAKGYLANFFSRKSSQSSVKAEIKPAKREEIATATATSSFRAPQSPVLAPHESGLKYLEQSQVRKLQEPNRLSVLSPPNEHSRSGSMQDELARLLKPSREERLAERNRFGGSSSSAKAVDSGARASLLAGERQVPPRPARPPLPPQPKRPVRTQ